MSGRQLYLNSAEDLQWAKDVHKVPAATKVVILYGNEDCPERLECYTQEHPKVSDEPFVVLPTADKPSRNIACVVKATAVNARHGTIFYHRTERNADGTAVRCRVMGKCKTWVRSPQAYRLPVKYGMYQSFYLTHRNSDVWLVSDPTAVPTTEVQS